MKGCCTCSLSEKDSGTSFRSVALGSSALSDLGQEENPVTFISPLFESHWSCWDERVTEKRAMQNDKLALSVPSQIKQRFFLKVL